MRLDYRSLYWRIGIGFIACVAAVLAVQGAVLLWLLSQDEADWRAQFTLPVAATLQSAIERDPQLDLRAFLDREVPEAPRDFYVVLRSGEVLYFGARRPSPRAIETVLDEFRRRDLRTIPHLWELPPYWASPLFVDGALYGTVSMVPRDLLTELWPAIAFLTVGLLVIGTIVASRFIFGPAHRRLQALEATALRLGAGDTSARADEAGGDEVASLAHTFNLMARDLSARADQIVEEDRTRRLLLADISHELMTPLTAIRGYQEKLAAATMLESPTLRRYIGIIGDEAYRVERIVRDLLDLARFESAAAVLDVQDVSLEGLFGRVAARHGGDATTRGVQLQTTIEPGAEIVRGDQYRLEQVLQNLAANALRHVTEGDTVTLHAELRGGHVVVTVRDTGVGIAEQHLPFIFDRFYKVDASRSAMAAGSGLGLSIVKAIVERHGGTIAVASTPSVGTAFTIVLPSGQDESALRRSA